ncbi:MAG: hypothetical protein MJZ89_06415 [Paludibacteraceae bacterium]|nr:hypothetical protein [Paludibacteraceae bacterium]
MQNEVVVLKYLWRFTFDQLDDNLFSERVMLDAELFHFSQVLFKSGHFLVCPRSFQDVATRYDTHLGVHVLQA